MITEAALATHGYREHAPPSSSNCDRAWSKTVKYEAGQKLFFIHVFAWNLGQYRAELGVQYQAEVRFYWAENDPLVGTTGFTVQLHLQDGASLADVESRFMQMYRSLGCCPDLHNN